MPEEVKQESKASQIAGKAVAATRKGVWQVFGAMFMEEKNGVQAVSMNKVLALVTYGACMWLWLGLTGGYVSPEVEVALQTAKLDVPRALKAAAEVPDAMLWTLWALLGINGASKLVDKFKGNGNGDSQPSA